MLLVLVLVNFVSFVKTTSMRKEVVHMSQFNSILISLLTNMLI